MKHLIIAPIFLFISLTSHAQSVAINTDGSSANASALLDVKSTTKGLLIPRMTTAQRTAVATPAKGLIVFDITSNGLWFHNGTAWIALSSGSTSNYWSLTGSDIYNNTSGNVGIGTGTPGAKLHIAGNVKIDGNNTLEFGAGIAGKEVSAGKIGYQSFGLFDALDIVGAGTAANRKIKFWNEGGAEFSGNVGVGNAASTYKMDIADRIRIRSGSVSSTAGIWLNNSNNSAASAFIGTKELDLVGFYGSTGSGWGLLMNTTTGNLAIGYQTPVAGYKLSVLGNQYINGLIATSGDAEIGGTAQVTGNLNVGGFIGLGGTAYVPIEVYTYTPFPTNYSSGWTTLNNGFTNSNVCMRANGNIIAGAFDAYSDARIKNVIGISSSAKDLEAINGLRITDYTMKDKVRYGDKPFKKVIAQEVEKVYPQVVTKNIGYIPNVYAIPAAIEKTANGYLLTFTDKHSISNTAKKIQLVIDRETKQFDIIDIPSDKQVAIKGAAFKTDKVFVYGEEVNDLRTVDYEGLTTLNISATQELSKLISEQNKKIKVLEEAINRLTGITAASETKQ